MQVTLPRIELNVTKTKPITACINTALIDNNRFYKLLIVINLYYKAYLPTFSDKL